MKENFNTKLYGWFYSQSCKKQLKEQYGSQMSKSVKRKCSSIIRRAKDIGPSRLLSAYCMAAYFIALNRNTDSYLSQKKMPGRQEWSAIFHKRQYENDWVVDVLEGNEEFDLGYNYLQCGIYKPCEAEKCFLLQIFRYIRQRIHTGIEIFFKLLVGLRLVRHHNNP